MHWVGLTEGEAKCNNSRLHVVAVIIVTFREAPIRKEASATFILAAKTDSIRSETSLSQRLLILEQNRIKRIPESSAGGKGTPVLAKGFFVSSKWGDRDELLGRGKRDLSIDIIVAANSFFSHVAKITKHPLSPNKQHLNLNFNNLSRSHDMASNAPGQCCTVGVKHEGSPTGEMKKIGDIETYFAYPKDKKTDNAILILTDVLRPITLQ